MIASILLDIGLDDDIIEVITSLTKEEIELLDEDRWCSGNPILN